MPDWMKPTLESRLQGEISIISDMQMTPLMAESKEDCGTEDLLDESERKE